MGPRGKCIIGFFCVTLVIVLIVVALVSTLPAPGDPGKWNSTQDNGTEDLSMGAIGLAPNRGNTGSAIDKTGKLKPKWG